MNPDYNTITMRTSERERAFRRFREMYYRLDQLIEALYKSGKYTVGEFDAMASEYHSLQPKADRLEEYIRRNFPATDLNETIARMKSFPFEDIYGNPIDDP